MSSENFNRIMEGLEEVQAIVEGRADPATYKVHVPAEVDVKALRQRLGLSQEAFALRYGFKPSAVREWEQRRRRPDLSARILLKVIEREPEAVERALAAA
jgi:putative transcriptional regulator